MNADEIEKLREMERYEESNLEIIMAKLSDVDSLVKAFEGCLGVFHTSAFTDPAGLSGYTVSFFLCVCFIFVCMLYRCFKNQLDKSTRLLVKLLVTG